MKQLSICFFACQHVKTIWNIIHIAIGLYPPRSISHTLGNWLTGIAREERKSIFVEVQLLFGQFGVHVMILFLRKNNILPFCMLPLGNVLAAGWSVPVA